MARKRGIKAAVKRVLDNADDSIDEVTAKVLETLGEVLDGFVMKTSIDMAKMEMVSRFILEEDEDDTVDNTGK